MNKRARYIGAGAPRVGGSVILHGHYLIADECLIDSLCCRNDWEHDEGFDEEEKTDSDHGSQDAESEDLNDGIE